MMLHVTHVKGLYPASADDYEGLADAIERLNLNDTSVTVRKETSEALGAGFRCAWPCVRRCVAEGVRD
jgi:translation elongation factor EF-4